MVLLLVEGKGLLLGEGHRFNYRVISNNLTKLSLVVLKCINQLEINVYGAQTIQT